MIISNFFPRYLLRWRFDFAGKPTVYGMWNNPHGKAWNVNKESLVRASIEGKDIQTREVVTLVECDGHVFVNFKWHAVFKFKGQGKYPGTPIGMIMQTTNIDVLMLMDGQSSTKDRTEEDKQYNYAGFGK